MAKKPVKEIMEETPESEVDVEAPKSKSKGVVIYTYVGGGESSPNVIQFMGIQKFVRGKATEVTDPVVLAKLKGHPTFVEGEVEMEDLHEYDETAKTEADAQRKKDIETNARYHKKFKTE